MSSWFLGRLEVSQAAREVPAPNGIFSCRILSVTRDRDLTRVAQAEGINRLVHGAWSSGRAGSACHTPPPGLG